MLAGSTPPKYLAVSTIAGQSMLATRFPAPTSQFIFNSHRGESPQKLERRITMKYMITWQERPQGTPLEYENAQKRILEVFGPWKAPANFKIESFVIRVGDWGGYMLMECDDPLEVHKFCSMLPAFVFEVHPVVPAADAIRVELEAMAYRDGLKNK
jgi:muconolactone delta-isomerase